MLRLVVIFSIPFILFSCYNDSNLIESDVRTESDSSAKYENVDPLLWDYFETFEEEATRRGSSIRLDQLALFAGIEEIHEDDVAGQCSYSSQSPNEITIDLSFWNQTNSAYRELVVFHELGHCVLGRGHRDEENEHGLCVSMMNSGLSGCNVLYNNTNRKAYLDELFLYPQ